MPIKVAVFNNKGGVGKTTISIILTQIALMHNVKVLAVDQDEQANFSSSIRYLKDGKDFQGLFKRSDSPLEAFTIKPRQLKSSANTYQAENIESSETCRSTKTLMLIFPLVKQNGGRSGLLLQPANPSISFIVDCTCFTRKL